MSHNKQNQGTVQSYKEESMDCSVILRRIKGLFSHTKKNQGTVQSYLEESRDFTIILRRIKGL